MKHALQTALDVTLVRKFLHYLNMKTQTAPEPYKLNTHRVIWEKAVLESAAYVEKHISQSMLFPAKEPLWNYTLGNIADPEGLCLEFGVHKGKSINYFAQRAPNRKFYGFDSFEGLAEDWVGHHRPKGSFSLNGSLPKVRSNVELITGWFDKTVPTFISQNVDNNLAFVHIDSDTYEAAVIVLEALLGKLKPGAIFLFDEYLGYPNWQNGEFRAWHEFVEKNDIQYRYLAFSTEQATIQIM